MGIRKIPSSSRLHQRFDEDASALMPLISREVARYSNVDHIIKLNSRRSYTVEQWIPHFEEAHHGT
ncbi:MAG: hypothetical protein KAG53_02920 [Endozoicomonadaceae bacterium]|nr:hypothetical protein [Endozoicomonadaceae bacterium]